MEDNLSKQAFWKERYTTNQLTWDIGSATPFLANFLQNNQFLRNKKICVLGCGMGHDVIEFARYNNEVYAIDFVDDAINHLIHIKDSGNYNIIPKLMDIFDLNKVYNSYFDVVYEYTCYCAIPLEKRGDYRKIVYDILCDKGMYLGILFPVGKKKSEGGPPFGVDIENTKEKFMKYFKLISCEDNPVSIDRRLDQEKVIVLEK